MKISSLWKLHTFRFPSRLVKNKYLVGQIILFCILINIIIVPPVNSSTNITATITTFGTITYSTATSALVLHVDGKNIKDSSGAVLYLRGANQPDFANDADGAWYGSTLWTDSNAKAQLDVMKSWGVNTVRCMFAVNQWKDNTIDTRSAIHDRDAIKRLISFAGDRGMYVILTGYTLKSTITVGQDAYQDPLPYPPYQTTPGGSSVISSQQDFVNFWASVANELKGYPNVIFELWNEPQGTSAVLNTWLSVSQQCITAIRNTGSQNLIIASGNNWGSAWVNLDSSSREDLSWVFNYPLTGGNIIYGVHLYSQHLQKAGSVATAYSDVNSGLSLMRYYDVANSYPLIVSEICPNMDSNTVNELTFFQNALSLFNSHGISYTAWGFWSATSFRLLSSESPNYTPNSAGTILKNAVTG
jgi:aryl-phospho-beta-D-glucosidase BglC (GH1 family)